MTLDTSNLAALEALLPQDAQVTIVGTRHACTLPDPTILPVNTVVQCNVCSRRWLVAQGPTAQVWQAAAGV